VARIDPIAIVDAKSKLDIFAKVLNPETLVMSIIIPKITTRDTITFSRIDKDANVQVSIVLNILC
jgi:hypothetical protein